MPHEDDVPKNYLMWMTESIGPIYLLLILGSAAFTFIFSLIIFLRARGTNAAVAWIFLAPLPLLIGIFGAMSGIVSSMSVIALSDTAIRASEFAGAVAEVLFRPLLAMLVSVPTYLVILIGSIYRALQTEEPTMIGGLEKPPTTR